MVRALLDSNQLVSSVLSARGVQGRIVDEWRRRSFELYMAPGQIEEIAEVLGRRKIAMKYALTADDRQAVIALLHAEAILLPDAPRPRVCRDPDDDYLLGCAAAFDLDYVVTGDRALLSVGQYRHVTILDGRRFLDLLSHLA